MPRQHDILYLNSTGLTPCSIGPHRVDIGEPFPPTAEGFARFATHLQRHPPGRRLTILADLADDAYHLEQLPFTRGKDRRSMLERRGRHLFGETPFTLTRSLGRSPEGRRDEQVLFAALPRPAAITPWLEPIMRAGHLLAGITTVPFLTRHLLPAKTTGPTLLAHATPGGFRVTCFEKGQPRFSRLTALPAASGPSGQNWQDELRRSTDYLINQRILPRDTPTPALLIRTQALELPADADLVALHPGLAIRLEPPATAADQPDSPLHTLLGIFLRHPGQAQFAPGTMLAPYRRQILAQASRTAAIAGLLLCAGLSLHDLGAIRDVRLEEEAMQARSRALEARVRTLHGTLGTAPANLAHLESDLALLETLRQGPQGPEADLRRLADTLSDNPGIQLDTLDWRNLLTSSKTRTPHAASRSLEIRLAAPDPGPQEALKPAALMHLLGALRQWPGTEVHQQNEGEASEPATQGADTGPTHQAPSGRPTIQVRWLRPE